MLRQAINYKIQKYEVRGIFNFNLLQSSRHIIKMFHTLVFFHSISFSGVTVNISTVSASS